MNSIEERLIHVTNNLERNSEKRLQPDLDEKFSEQEAVMLQQMALIEGNWQPTHVLPEDSMDITKPYDFNTKQVGETFVTNIVNRQVPGYKEMRRANVSMTKRIVHHIYESDQEREIKIFDSGCSNGAAIFDLLSALSHNYGKPGEVHPAINNISYVGIDIAEAMIDRANETLEDFISLFKKLGVDLEGKIIFNQCDAMETSELYANFEADVCISTLMTMFLPVHQRFHYFEDLGAITREGGYLILTEKTLAENREYNDILTELYHIDKFKNGLSLQAIRNKHLSLPRFLHPLKSEWTAELVKESGFEARQLFWKHYMFESSIAKRGKN